jgi:hypothetical protein
LCKERSEGNIVVGNGAFDPGADRNSRRRGFARLLAAIGWSAEQDHVARADLGRPSLVAVLIIPLAGLKTSLDIDQPSLGQVLIADFREPVPDDDIVPFGPLLFFAGLAIEKRQNGVPLAVYFISGSRPRRPTRMTLFTDFAMDSSSIAV